jgi:hypothetical protein
MVLTKSRCWFSKSRQVREDLVTRWSRISSDTRRDYGGSIADTRLQLGLVVSASKLKTTGLWFGPKNLGQDLGVSCGIIGDLAPRQSYFMEGSSSSTTQNRIWTILPLGLSGWEKISEYYLMMCSIHINKDIESAKNNHLSHLARKHRLAKFSLSMGLDVVTYNCL